MEVGKIRIDFTVLQELNPQLIKIQDASEWFSSEEKQATLIVFPPGSTKGIANVFAKHETTILTSKNLGLGCDINSTDLADLSDGVWKICLQSAYQGLEKTRYYLKTCRFKIEWYKEFANLGFQYVDTNNPKYEALYDVRKHLSTAESFIIDGDFTKANREFTEAQKKFNKIRECQNCF
jgi:hypothetical protein